MKKVVQICILVSIVLLTSGCIGSISNVSYNEKYKEKLTESLIMNRYGGMRISYKFNHYSKENLLETCKKKANELNSYLSKNNTIDEEFLARNIKLTTIQNARERVLIITPIEYKSEDTSSCTPKTMLVTAKLYDIEDLTKNWKNENLVQKMDKLINSKKRTLMWEATFDFNFYKNGIKLKEKDVLDNLSNLVINELNKTGLLPRKVKSIEEVREIQAKRRLEKEKQSKISHLAKINCSKIKSNIGIGYDSKSHIMCVGNLSFSDASLVSSKKTMAFLNASQSTHKYELKNSSCKAFALSYVSGSKNDSGVNFDSTYKDQILKYYENSCEVKQINNINFLSCKKNDDTGYFLENSEVFDKRIYKKELLQMNKSCFNKFKQYYNKENIGSEWRTPYGVNNLGWNAFDENVFTKSKYDKDGYDVKGWNTQKINRHTNNEYGVDGYTFDGMDKDGVNRNGFDVKQKKFIRYVSGESFPFKINQFKSSAKNKLYNSNYYSDVKFVKQKDGFQLVAEKIYGDKDKPEKIEIYYYRPEKGKFIDLENPKAAVFDKKLILEKKETRLFDKNGLDEDGYDINNWNPKLQKRRN